MKRTRSFLITALLLFMLALGLAACDGDDGAEPTLTPAPAVEVTVEADQPAATPTEQPTPTAEIPAFDSPLSPLPTPAS